MQGVSCFGPACEFAMMADCELRRRKIRDRVPMTFAIPEPYIGHLGLGGVGDTKGQLEPELRSRHIRRVTNARTRRIAPGRLYLTEADGDGKDQKDHEIPFRFGMMMLNFRGVKAATDLERLVNSRGFVQVDHKQRSAEFPNVISVGRCIAIPPVEATPVPTGVPKT